MFSNPALPLGYIGLGPMAASALEVFAHATAPRGKPEFGINSVTVDGAVHAVTEAIVLTKPFGDLRRFSHAGVAPNAP